MSDTTFLIIIALILLGSASWPMYRKFRENPREGTEEAREVSTWRDGCSSRGPRSPEAPRFFAPPPVSNLVSRALSILRLALLFCYHLFYSRPRGAFFFESFLITVAYRKSRNV